MRPMKIPLVLNEIAAKADEEEDQPEESAPKFPSGQETCTHKIPHKHREDHRDGPPVVDRPNGDDHTRT